MRRQSNTQRNNARSPKRPADTHKHTTRRTHDGKPGAAGDAVGYPRQERLRTPLVGGVVTGAASETSLAPRVRGADASGQRSWQLFPRGNYHTKPLPPSYKTCSVSGRAFPSPHVFLCTLVLLFFAGDLTTTSSPPPRYSNSFLPKKQTQRERERKGPAPCAVARSHSSTQRG